MPTLIAKSNSGDVDSGAGTLPTSGQFSFRSPREFAASFQPADVTVVCPTRAKLPAGTPVVVTVRLGRRKPPLSLHGTVAWHRPGRHREKIRAGIGVLLSGAEAPKWTYLLDSAHGTAVPATPRRQPRVRVDLPVRWHPVGAEDPIPGWLCDIGRGGAFVRSDRQVQQSERVVLELAPPGAAIPMAFTARVAWTGQSGPDQGFGVQWLARDAGGGRRIHEVVRRLVGP